MKWARVRVPGSFTPAETANIPAAWRWTRGDAGIVIAIIDVDFNPDDPDLSDSVRSPFDAVSRDQDVGGATLFGAHGTECARIAVGRRPTDRPTGAAPRCSWMPIRIGTRWDPTAQRRAFEYALRCNADVLCCPWGPYGGLAERGSPMPEPLRHWVERCARHGRAGKGMPIVFAAGNDRENVSLNGYASHPDVIAVAATTCDDRTTSTSNYGGGISICAPAPSAQPGTVGGLALSTSASAALVAGTIGLMLAANPTLTVHNTKSILARTADKIGGRSVRLRRDRWGHSYTDAYDQHGHSAVYGRGRVNAAEAVRVAAGS